MLESALHMPRLIRQLTVCASLVALAACASTPAPAPVTAELPAPAPVVVQKSAHDRLFDLFKASDEDSLKRNPLNALFRGDLRYADRLGDGISDEYYAAERAAAEADLAALQAIPRAELNATDQSPRLFSIFAKIRCAGQRTCLADRVRPMNISQLPPFYRPLPAARARAVQTLAN